jgi:dolichol-phosphate mannosyltransferase
MTETRRAVVCLPTYNERDNLRPIVEAILAATPEADVLVIDDSSPDGRHRAARR